MSKQGMSFHEAVSAMSDMVGLIEDSGMLPLMGAVMAFQTQNAIYRHIEKRALFAEQERQITPDEWESIDDA